MKGGGGADQLIGGTGNDTAGYSNSAAGVVINLATHSASGGDAAGDTLSGIESITGSAQNDRLIGNSSANTLAGLGGKDVLTGNGHADTLAGGGGPDKLRGGSGPDHFVYLDVSDSTPAHHDTILDFRHGQHDKIDLSGVDANSGTAGVQHFNFIGTSGFSGTAGELRYHFAGHNTKIYGDVDGDGTADFVIVVHHHVAFVGGDFISS